MKKIMLTKTPKEIVKELDKYIIGQEKAKKFVSIALRNRYRRMKIKNNIKNEITPKNILMIGPTGVGKTEISRRLAKLANAPFIKVEATKFTEIGYVGRDVESIIRDLIDIAIKQTKENVIKEQKDKIEKIVEEKILNIIIPQMESKEKELIESNEDTRQIFRKKLREGQLNEKEIEINISKKNMGVEIMTIPGIEEISSQMQNIFANMSGNKLNKKKMKVKIKEARKILKEEESSKLINDEEIRINAIEETEQNGIVFLDEIDKVTQRSGNNIGGDISREGVQRDLLPLIEGCNVSTKYGIIKTNHILFIASGAFHTSKPSDLIPELQGRLPIKVELNSLTSKDFSRILLETNANLTNQYSELLLTENIELKFTKNSIKKISEIAWEINEQTENIGARRLHTVMEFLLEDILFNASETKTKKIIINKIYFKKKLKKFIEYENLNKFIL